MGFSIQSTMIRLAQELMTTFGNMPNEAVMITGQVGQVVTDFLWLTNADFLIFKTANFSIDFSIKQTDYIQMHKVTLLCEYLKCCPQLTTHIWRIKG